MNTYRQYARSENYKDQDFSSLGYKDLYKEHGGIDVENEIVKLFSMYGADVNLGYSHPAQCGVWRAEQIQLLSMRNIEKYLPRFANRVHVFQGIRQTETEDEKLSYGRYLGYVSLRPEVIKPIRKFDYNHIVVAYLAVPAFMQRPRYHLITGIGGFQNGVLPFRCVPFCVPSIDSDRYFRAACLLIAIHQALLLKMGTFDFNPVSSQDMMSLLLKAQEKKKVEEESQEDDKKVNNKSLYMRIQELSQNGIDFNTALDILRSPEVHAGGILESFTMRDITPLEIIHHIEVDKDKIKTALYNLFEEFEKNSQVNDSKVEDIVYDLKDFSYIVAAYKDLKQGRDLGRIIKKLGKAKDSLDNKITPRMINAIIDLLNNQMIIDQAVKLMNDQGEHKKIIDILKSLNSSFECPSEIMELAEKGEYASVINFFEKNDLINLGEKSLEPLVYAFIILKATFDLRMIFKKNLVKEFRAAKEGFKKEEDIFQEQKEKFEKKKKSIEAIKTLYDDEDKGNILKYPDNNIEDYIKDLKEEEQYYKAFEEKFLKSKDDFENTENTDWRRCISSLIGCYALSDLISLNVLNSKLDVTNDFPDNVIRTKIDEYKDILKNKEADIKILKKCILKIDAQTKRIVQEKALACITDYISNGLPLIVEREENGSRKYLHAMLVFGMHLGFENKSGDSLPERPDRFIVHDYLLHPFIEFERKQFLDNIWVRDNRDGYEIEENENDSSWEDWNGRKSGIAFLAIAPKGSRIGGREVRHYTRNLLTTYEGYFGQYIKYINDRHGVDLNSSENTPFENPRVVIRLLRSVQIRNRYFDGIDGIDGEALDEILQKCNLKNNGDFWWVSEIRMNEYVPYMYDGEDNPKEKIKSSAYEVPPFLVLLWRTRGENEEILDEQDPDIKICYDEDGKWKIENENIGNDKKYPIKPSRA